MADSSIPITAGVGVDVDTRTAPDGNHRQVMVIGSPTTATAAEVSSAGALLVQGYQSARTAGTITTATSVVGPVDVAQYNIVTVTLRGTHAGINVTFEASDDGGTSWFSVVASRTDVATAAATSGVITSNASWAWDIPIGAFTHVRVRATAWTSGSGVVGITAQSMPYEPCPTVLVGNSVAISGSLTSAGTTTATPATPTASTISSAATTNATAVKTSAGTAYSVTASNTGAGAAFVKLFNKATAPTVGTDVPVLTMTIPASGTVNVSFGATGHRFTTGIALAITGAAADADTTAVALAQVKVLTSYI